MKQRLFVLAVVCVAFVPLVAGETYVEDFSSNPGISRIQFDDSDKDQLATTPLQGSGHSVGRIEFEITKIRAEDSLSGEASPGFWTGHNVNNASSARLDFIPENEGACPGTSETRSRLSTNKYDGSFNSGKDYCTGQTGFYTVEFRLLGNSEVEITYLDDSDNVLVEDNITHTDLVFNYLGVQTFRGTAGGSYETSYDANEEAIYFEGARYTNNVTGYIHNITYGDDLQTKSNLTINARDAFNNDSIQSFSADLTGQTTGTSYDLNTSTGTLTTPVLSNSTELWDVTVNASEYQERTYQNINVSTNTTLTAELRQSQSKFTRAYTKVSNTSLTDFNITVQGQTFQSNTTFASPTEYNATFTKNGWYNKTEEYKQATLNQTFTDVYDHKLTINASEIRQGLTINNFSGSINHSSGYTENFSTTNGNVTLNIESNKTYTVRITNTSDDFATRYNSNNSLIMKDTFTVPANKSSTKEFQTYTFNSVEFNVFNVDNTTNVVGQQVNISLINGPQDRELTSQNGYLFTDDLLTGSYTARIRSSGFATQDYFFTVEESTFQTIDVYLDKTTTQIFFTIVDGQRNPVEGAVQTMRTKLNGTSVVVGQKSSDFSGTTSFLLNPDKTYTFTVTKDGFSTFQGTVTPTLTEYTVPLSAQGTKTFTSPLQGVDVSTNVTTGNNTFEFFYDIVAFDNDLESTSYKFTYDQQTYKDSVSSQPSGATFTENITRVPTDDDITVEYKVTRSGNTETFTRTFLVQRTSDAQGFTTQGAGPVTLGVIAILTTTFLVTISYITTQNPIVAAVLGAGTTGFFAWQGFLPITVTSLTVGLLVLLAYGRSRVRAGV